MEQYHTDEMILILLILASELSNFSEDDLISFSEDIEGRIDVLFTRDFLSSIAKTYEIKDDVIDEFERIKDKVKKLYSPQWHKRLRENNGEVVEIRLLARRVLNSIGVKYVDPKEFSNGHLNID